MYSVTEAAKILGISSSRVRKLIADGKLEAKKVGNSWAVEDRVVAGRALSHPPVGRPSRAQDISFESSPSQDLLASARKIYLSCKENLSCIPSDEMLLNAESSEEAAFYVTVSDFFLQQRQQELIAQGVF